MFRKRFAARQRLKKDIVVIAAAERNRRRLLGLLPFDRRRPLVYFTEDELAYLQPFASMLRLDDDTLEEDVMALMEAEDEAARAAWLKNLGRYRCVEECKRER